MLINFVLCGVLEAAVAISEINKNTDPNPDQFTMSSLNLIDRQFIPDSIEQKRDGMALNLKETLHHFF